MQQPHWVGPEPGDACEPADWAIGDPTFLADTFDRPRRASPWAGHRWFAYDLIAATQPRLIVELGTHYGCSFFSFCQSVADHSLPTKIVGVDTWEGDPHAGTYDGVYEHVSDWVATYFGSVDVELRRTTFDAAEQAFELGPIDLLHIDGFHSYEAAQHDYESWAHRLSDHGTVLFHDVDPDTGYGSADYWRDLAGAEGGFMFLHSFGLGVLTRSPHLRSLFASEAFLPTARYYAARAGYDLATMMSEDLSTMVEARDESIASMTKLVQDRDEAVTAMNALVEARDEAIASMTAMIDDRDEAIASMTAMIDARDAEIRAMSATIAQLSTAR